MTDPDGGGAPFGAVKVAALLLLFLGVGLSGAAIARYGLELRRRRRP